MTAERLRPLRALLPPAAYWSDEWFDTEQERLFGATWHLAATACELGRPGDYATVDAGHDPLVVVRTRSGAVRAFHNRCPHRAVALCEGRGNTGERFVCPYHAWSFDLDGTLRRVPQRAQFAGLDADAHGLDPAGAAEWAGLVFAHPDPGAGLAAHLGELPAHIGSFRPELLVPVDRFTIEARCNWKLFVENHVDVYHLWYLHARTLADYDHGRFEWRQLGRNWASYEPLRAGAPTRRPSRTVPPIAHLDARDRAGIGAHLLFPNVMIASEAQSFVVYVARPVRPDLTAVDVRILAEPGADAAALADAARAFMAEDVAACEAVQRTVRSSRFRVGALAGDHERPVVEFQRNVLDALGVHP